MRRRYLTRKNGEVDRFDDPICWLWPAPESCTFPDAYTAERFLRWWNRACAICEDEGGLVEDHDHETGLVRGYLCRSCNTQEGYAGQLPGEPEDMFAKYRRRNPATILGIEAYYSNPRSGLVCGPPTPAAT